MEIFHWSEIHYLHHQITPTMGMTLPEGYVAKVRCRLAKESQKQHLKEDRYVCFDTEYIKHRVNKLLSKIPPGTKASLLSSLIEELRSSLPEKDGANSSEKLLTPTELQEVTTEESISEIEVEQV